MTVLRLKVLEAKANVGGLSRPGKMPGPAWSISAFDCKRGGKLANVPGSVCRHCYARGGRYTSAVVKAAQAERLRLAYRPEWVPSMVRLIEGRPVFRWFDSGDLQGKIMFARIQEVARLTPGTRHWLPTHEHGLLLASGTFGTYAQQAYTIPDNMIVRLSADMINGRPPSGWAWTSTVETADGGGTVAGVTCPASLSAAAGDPENATCDAHGCRACWDRDVPNVAYRLHIPPNVKQYTPPIVGVANTPPTD
jgi:hypothetical protein